MNIKLENNICRTCMSSNNLKPLQDLLIIRVLHMITNIDYTTVDELPQQMCEICICKINEIQAFAVQCVNTDLVLKQRDYKYNALENETIVPVESVQIKQEINFLTQNTTERCPDPLDFQEPCAFLNISIKEEIRTTSVENAIRFECDICGKTYSKQSHLKRHKLIHSGKKLFKCDICSKCFGVSSSLTRHKIIHTKEKQFSCDICSKAFNDSSNLRQHKFIHTNNRNYKCELCSKTYNNYSTLRQHKFTHEPIQVPFTCKICFETFTRLNSLVRHHKRKH